MNTYYNTVLTFLEEMFFFKENIQNKSSGSNASPETRYVPRLKGQAAVGVS